MTSTPDSNRVKPAILPHDLILKMVTVLGLAAGFGVTSRQILLTDFPVDMIIYREGVRAFLDGGEMYSVPMMAGNLALPFIYPPFGALALVPLTIGDFFNHNMAGNILIVLSSALILLCLYLVARTIASQWLDRPSLLAVTAVLWPAALLIEPVWLKAGFAQVNVVIMALVILDLIPRRRFLPQGALIGIAAAIKISPLAMLLFFLLRRDFRAIAVAVVAALSATAVAAALRWDATVEYFSTVLLGMGTDSEFGVDSTYQSNSSLKGMIMRWYTSSESLEAHSTQANIIWLVLVVVTIGLGSWLMISLMRREMLVDAVLVNAVIMLLISPISWSHHWVWLTILLPVVAWRCLTVLGAPKALSAITLVFSALVLSNPAKWWFGDAIDVHALGFWEKLLISDFVWLSILLLMAWAIALRTVPRVDPESSQAAKNPAPLEQEPGRS